MGTTWKLTIWNYFKLHWTTATNRVCFLLFQEGHRNSQSCLLPLFQHWVLITERTPRKYWHGGFSLVNLIICPQWSVDIFSPKKGCVAGIRWPVDARMWIVENKRAWDYKGNKWVPHLSVSGYQKIPSSHSLSTEGIFLLCRGKYFPPCVLRPIHCFVFDQNLIKLIIFPFLIKKTDPLFKVRLQTIKT